MNYQLHPLCTLFPRMVGAEFDALCSDIKANGLRSPVVIHDGMILDGGNRYRACLEVGIAPDVVEFDGINIVSFVLSANLHRRHMTPGQQAAIVASAQDWNKAQSVGNPKLTQKCNVAPLETVADRAAESGSSIRTQKMADKVAKANPELAKQVAHGNISLPKAVAQVDGKKNKASSVIEMSNEDDYDMLSELKETVVSLADENTSLKDRLAVAVIACTEEEKTAALDTIESLRAEVKRLEIEVRALTDSRNSYQRENAELKRQCAMQRRQLEKLSMAAA